MTINVKRIYEEPSDADGFRVLVDRLWPRGMSKARAELSLWLREAAPSDALRKWYHHDPEKWEEFKRRYFAELDKKTEALEPILANASEGVVTLLFSSKELQYNNAWALKLYLEGLQ